MAHTNQCWFELNKLFEVPKTGLRVIFSDFIQSKLATRKGKKASHQAL